MLSSGRKTRGYARYSPALFSPFLFCLIGRCSRCWSLGVQEQEIPDADHRNMKIPDAFYNVEFPLTRSSLEVPRQEASPFRSVVICASLLKETLYSCVCTQILLLPLTLCSRAVVFEPSWPLACIKQLVLFYL